MPPEGLEPSRFPAGNSRVSEPGGSKSGNKDAPFGISTGELRPTDPELAAVAAAWPDLPAALRAGILAMVRAALQRTDE
jgi:hypothetical protein